MITQIGIDKIGFYTPQYYLDLATLATHRNESSDKYYNSIGQRKITIAPPNEDIVTMAANAAENILTKEDKERISTVIFATETGIDQSKSAAVYVHKLLGLPINCRAIETKQACYAATFCLQTALALLRSNPKDKILLLAADIARYEINSPAEASQGAGAIAILLSVDPQVMVIEPESGFVTEDVMDFWRPNYRKEPLVLGKYSCEVYLHALEKTWKHYCANSQRTLKDHKAFCYHVPVPKLAEKANNRLMALHNSEHLEFLPLDFALRYNREVGNCYTAGLYISLLSLLENNERNMSNYRIGLYSYGSGYVAEFFSGVVQPNYLTVLNQKANIQLLNNRTELDYAQYLEFYNFELPIDGSECNIPQFSCGKFRLIALKDHKRIYS